MRKIESDLLRAYECEGEFYADLTLTLPELRALERLADIDGNHALSARLWFIVKEAEEELALPT